METAIQPFDPQHTARIRDLVRANHLPANTPKLCLAAARACLELGIPSRSINTIMYLALNVHAVNPALPLRILAELTKHHKHQLKLHIAEQWIEHIMEGMDIGLPAQCCLDLMTKAHGIPTAYYDLVDTEMERRDVLMAQFGGFGRGRKGTGKTKRFLATGHPDGQWEETPNSDNWEDFYHSDLLPPTIILEQF